MPPFWAAWMLLISDGYHIYAPIDTVIMETISIIEDHLASLLFPTNGIMETSSYCGASSSSVSLKDSLLWFRADGTRCIPEHSNPPVVINLACVLTLTDCKAHTTFIFCFLNFFFSKLILTGSDCKKFLNIFLFKL